MKPQQLPAQQFINDTSKSPDSALAVSFSRTKQLSASRKNQLDSAVKMISEPLPVVPQTEERKEETKTEKSDSQVKVPEQIPVKEILPPPAKKETNNKTETQEEKKGFLKGIFKKKKKEQDDIKKSENNEQ